MTLGWSDGRLVLLADQDRRRWHDEDIDEARRLLDHPSLRGPISAQAAAYTLQARIAPSTRSRPPRRRRAGTGSSACTTSCSSSTPTPAARLARAVAVAEDRGPAAGLAALEGVEIPASHRPAAVRAELLARTGDVVAARAAYDQAIAACGNDVERAHLQARLEALG